MPSCILLCRNQNRNHIMALNRKSIRTLAHCIILTGLLSFSGCSLADIGKKPVDYVDPYIGNISHLLVPTYPTVHLPNGMLRVCPSRADYTSGHLHGLPVAVTSHRGPSAFYLSPYNEIFSADAAMSELSFPGTAPVIDYTFDHEEISPYKYYVYLDAARIHAEFAPSFRAGIWSFGYEAGSACLRISAGNGDISASGSSISGSQKLDGGTVIYFYAETDASPLATEVISDGKRTPGMSAEGGNAALDIRYGTDELTLGYGISFISIDQAEKNMKNEIGGRTLEEVASDGRRIWNDTLGKIRVKGGTEQQKTVFYTALYRTYERMVNISEDGKYFSAFDRQVHEDGGLPFYTDDWIWDTYRAVHPLRILIEPEKETAMLNSYIRMAEQSGNGWMPTFPEITGDSHRMNGNHAVATFRDAWVKGLGGFDLGKAYDACRRTITEKTLLPWSDCPLTELDRFYWENGWYPALDYGEKETCPQVHGYERRQAVSVSLGNSYDCWCLAGIAGELGHTADSLYFGAFAQSYRNLFNSETGFFHPRDAHGRFIEPFDPRYAGGLGARDYYCENNAWIYRWDVQHDIDGLIALTGGKEKFCEGLDEMFAEPLGQTKFEFYSHLPDHTGNVGQFSMANEPCLHIPYLYNFAGQPWKTQKRVRTLLDQWFRADLMGMPGDEDGGGMSAFIVFSMMGFYPVTPGIPAYSIGSPVFEKTVISLGNGKKFTIRAKNCSGRNKYIQSARLDGKAWNSTVLPHEAVASGGRLDLEMGPEADYGWGTAPDTFGGGIDPDIRDKRKN